MWKTTDQGRNWRRIMNLTSGSVNNMPYEFTGEWAKPEQYN